MSIWFALLAVFLAGALGGILNALMTDNGFVLPRAELGNKSSILRPGYLGNALTGAVAAVISWGLYGPASSIPLIFLSGEDTSHATATSTAVLTVAGFVGAILVGIGGARWLSAEIDKSLLRAAASQAAAANKNDQLAVTLAAASPAEAFRAAKEAPR